MATKTMVSVVDDIDGTEGAETVTFSYRGNRYEIDLASENMKALDAALTPFIGAARKVKSVGNGKPMAPEGKQSPAAIRAWAADNGIEVPSRGRIPAVVIEQYNNRA